MVSLTDNGMFHFLTFKFGSGDLTGERRSCCWWLLLLSTPSEQNLCVRGGRTPPYCTTAVLGRGRKAQGNLPADRSRGCNVDAGLVQRPAMRASTSSPSAQWADGVGQGRLCWAVRGVGAAYFR